MFNDIFNRAANFCRLFPDVIPAEKVGGSRRKGKERAHWTGKKRQRASSGSEDNEPAPKRGRPAGSGNYNKEDTSKLFVLIEEDARRSEGPAGQASTRRWMLFLRFTFLPPAVDADFVGVVNAIVGRACAHNANARLM
ncbi:hypothetical protein B0H13DRAFT_1908145 [Mycena leptocephala]|nr:hypothetical protein B0H13DRAFT_1908145 [Mycena leptocephala]